MTHELARLPPSCTTAVFVGPTLPKAEVQDILPDAVILPPVRFGDLYALIASGIELVVIIDGVFHGHPPVWQREIAAVLALGMRVVGTSSMGALRALELAPYGMIGIGEVVRWYRDGRIEGDDEVALLHADEEMGYLPLSLPLVDIRATLDEAVSSGKIRRGLASSIVAKLKTLSHAERTRDKVLAVAEQAGAPQGALACLADRLLKNSASVKAQDARKALTLCRTPELLAAGNELKPCCPIRSDKPPVEPLESVMMRAACCSNGQRFRISHVLHWARRNEPDIDRRLQDEVRRWYLSDWCSIAAVGPDEAAVAEFAESWLHDHAGGAPDMWLRENGLHKDELKHRLVGRCAEAWLEEQVSEALPLTLASQHPVIDQVLADWARRMQVTAPDETGTEPSDMAEWLIHSSPAFFGAVSWQADRALVQGLQVDGEIARFAAEMRRQGASDEQ